LKFLPHIVGERTRISGTSGVGPRRWRRRLSLPVFGQEKATTPDLLSEVAASIGMKVQDDSRLRAQVAREQAEQISSATLAIHERLAKGGKLILFGNGGSATDANDFAIDCILPPAGYRPIPAVSLSLEPANITAVANDVGTEVIFSAATHRAGPSGRMSPSLFPPAAAPVILSWRWKKPASGNC